MISCVGEQSGSPKKLLNRAAALYETEAQADILANDFAELGNDSGDGAGCRFICCIDIAADIRNNSIDKMKFVQGVFLKGNAAINVKEKIIRWFHVD